MGDRTNKMRRYGKLKKENGKHVKKYHRLENKNKNKKNKQLVWKECKDYVEKDTSKSWPILSSLFNFSEVDEDLGLDDNKLDDDIKSGSKKKKSRKKKRSSKKSRKKKRSYKKSRKKKKSKKKSNLSKIIQKKY